MHLLLRKMHSLCSQKHRPPATAATACEQLFQKLGWRGTGLAHVGGFLLKMPFKTQALASG